MKNSKQLSFGKLITMALLCFSVVFTSCDSDDDPVIPAPTISDMELGISNSKIAYAGSDLHMDAEIEAPGKIKTIKVEIHMEDNANAWEFEKTWTEFEGKLNTNFHKHIDIPANADIGTYHFHLEVTDMLGNETEYEAEDFQIKELVDTEKPTISVSSSPAANATFANGETITISGQVKDNISLAGMLVALVRTDDNIADADVKGGNKKVIVMLHTHDFGDHADEYDFNASIKVGAAKDNNMTPADITGENAWENGDHYLLIRVKDIKGNWTFSQKYPIKISL